jgi:hypothetical protein
MTSLSGLLARRCSSEKINEWLQPIMTFSLPGSFFGNCRRFSRMGDRAAGVALLFVLLACVPCVNAQLPQYIAVSKTGFHQQVSSTSVVAQYTAFAVNVYMPDPAPASLTVRLKKPDGTFVVLEREEESVFVWYDYLQNEALLASAYPDGNYQILVAGGSSDSTTSFSVSVHVIPPVRTTNFDALQSSGANPQVSWQLVPVHGASEILNLYLLSSGGIWLSEQEMPSADVVTATFSNLLAGESYTGVLTYYTYSGASTNAGETEIVQASGFNMSFPVVRGATTAAVPAAPGFAGAYASGPTEVTLAWQPPLGANPATGYKLERATDLSFTAPVTLSLGAATTYLDTTVSANTTYYYRLSATNSIGSSAPSAAMKVVTPASAGTGASKFVNIATRALCSTGNNVTIGGFVVSGTTNKRVLLRAVGPSLTAHGLGASEVLLDPTIAVHKGTQVIATNDNWGTNTNVADIATIGAQLGATPLIDSDTKSAALLVTLSPGVYSFIVNGQSGTSGVVLLEVYDADDTPSTFVNIATRAYSTSANGVTIGGFVINGGVTKRILLRAVGPTLTSQGLGTGEVLADPVIELHAGAPVIATNDNWTANGNASDLLDASYRIGATPFSASDTSSAALLVTLPPGVYSFVARDKANASGIVLVEVYDAD